MSKPDSDDRFGSSDCYALIPYRPPSRFASMDQAILRHGKSSELQQVMFASIIRSLGIPKQMVSDDDCNYSSARAELVYMKSRNA